MDGVASSADEYADEASDDETEMEEESRPRILVDTSAFREHGSHESARGTVTAIRDFVTASVVCPAMRRAGEAFAHYMVTPLYDAVNNEGSWESLVPVWYRWRPPYRLPQRGEAKQQTRPWTNQLVWARAVPVVDYRRAEEPASQPHISQTLLLQTLLPTPMVKYMRDQRHVTYNNRGRYPVFWVDTVLCADVRLQGGTAVVPAGYSTCYAFMPSPCTECALALPASNNCRQARPDLPYVSSVDGLGWKVGSKDQIETFFDARALVALHSIVEAWSIALPSTGGGTLAHMVRLVVEYFCTADDVANRN